MRIIQRIAAITCTVLVIFSYQQTKAQTSCSFLVWSDEFTVDGLPDTNYWGYDIGDGCEIGLCGWGNNEAQYYTYRDEDNARVENGKLILEARKEQMGGKEYTSARLNTKDLLEITYGRVDISAKLPGGGGIWSALWMLGDPEIYGTWPKNGEIDIMEYVNSHPDTVLGTIHCPTNYGGNGDGNSIAVPTAETDFHEYSITWNPDSITFYVDNIAYHTYHNNNEGVDQWPYNKPFHLLLNIAIGGNLGGEIDDNLFDAPVTMEIDYIRIYQEPEHTAIEGKSEVAKGEANLSYFTTIPANKYIWHTPADANNILGQGTSKITLDWGCIADTISLTLETDCDTNTIKLPVAVTEIKLSGPTEVHPKEEKLEYNIPSLRDANYVWSIPSDANLNTTADSNAITLNWGCIDSTVTVNYTSYCNNSGITKEVQIVQPQIKGPLYISEKTQGATFSIDSILNSTYNWTVPAGATITAGQNTTTITTDWTTSGGLLSVDVENVCGITSDEIEISISDDILICNFEAVDLDFLTFGEAFFTKVLNPSNSEANNSKNVGETFKGENAASWGGIYADLGYALNFENNNTFTMDVYAPKTGVVLFKIENNDGGFKEVSADIATINEWHTLSFEFPEAESNSYLRIALFFDFGTTATDTFYFDNIIMTYKEPESEVLDMENQVKMTIYPNPSNESINIDLPCNSTINKLIISDITGRILLMKTTNINQNIDISALTGGKYIISVYTYNKDIYHSSFIKN